MPKFLLTLLLLLQHSKKYSICFKMCDKMSTAKAHHEFSTLFKWSLSKLDRFYQLAKSDLYGGA